MSDDNSFQKPRSSAEESFDQLSQTMSHIKGWAIDANSKNDPTYTLRERFEGDSSGNHWSKPTRQQNADGILQSNERTSLSSVFGTSAPLSKLSGALRRYAFRFSEGRYPIGYCCC